MIEVFRKDSAHQYRISPTDKRNIDWRENKHGARWTLYCTRDTAREAKATLLRLESGTWQEEDTNK